MNPEEMKSAWNTGTQPFKKEEELNQMTSEKKHPVLSRIRKQLLIELIMFGIFLVVYYDFFDGDRKPFYANFVLVAAALTAMVHNILLYRITSRPLVQSNLKESLYARLASFKIQGTLSVASRLLWAACLLVFFSAGIVFNQTKYLILAAAIALMLVQLVILSRMWIRRTKQLKETLFIFEG